MRIRPHVAWYVRWGMRVPFVVIALAVAWWAYDYGLQLAGFQRGKSQQEVMQLQEKVVSLSSENLQLNKKVAEYEQQIQIDHAQAEELVKQAKTLTDENVRLEEDLSLFQNLTVNSGKEGELSMHRLKLERDSVAGEFRVKMLLVHSGQRAKPFVGHYQLVASYVQNGKKLTALFPVNEADGAEFKLDFKYYHRVEQTLRVPVDAELDGVQVRIFEHNAEQPKIRQNVSVS